MCNLIILNLYCESTSREYWSRGTRCACPGREWEVQREKLGVRGPLEVGGAKENRETMARKNSEPYCLSALDFYWASHLDFPQSLLCLHYLIKSLPLWYILSTLSLFSAHWSSMQIFRGGPRTLPLTPTTQTLDCQKHFLSVLENSLTPHQKNNVRK